MAPTNSSNNTTTTSSNHHHNNNNRTQQQQHDKPPPSSLSSATTTTITSSSSSSSPRRDLEEALFGPTRTCPLTVWNAVLDGNLVKSLDAQHRGAACRRLSLPCLRRMAAVGLPEEGGHRGLVWRVLLGCLGTEPERWAHRLQQQRAAYRRHVRRWFDAPRILTEGPELRGKDWNHSQFKRRRRRRRRKKKKATKRQMGGEGEMEEEEEEAVLMEEEQDDDEEEEEENSNGMYFYYDDEEDEEDYLEHQKDITQQLIHRQICQELSKGHDDGDEDDDENGNPNTTNHGGATNNKKSLSVLKTDDDDNNDNNNDNNTAAQPIHVPATQDGFSALIPARVREEWKRLGMTELDLSSSHQHLNTLLVVRDNEDGEDNDGDEHQNDNTEEKQQQQQDDDKRTNTSHESAPTDKDKAETEPPEQQKQPKESYQQFYEHCRLLDEIRKDVVRTHPDLFFFLEPKDGLGQRRYAALERILFVWARLNHSVKYVQGMNEIAGTIYYVLANDPNEEWAFEAEADSFYLFHTLVSEMRDVFVPDLDQADTGIQGRISNMTSLLSLHDPEVRCHLVDIGIDPTFFAIRWLTTLLSREFALADTIRLWDSMFASTHKDNFMRYVCVTMVMIIRGKLLQGDFGQCLRLLQSYPPTDIDRLLEASRALWIYESQVTLACHKGGISLHQALCTITPPPSVLMAYGLPGGVAQPSNLAAENQRSGLSKYGGNNNNNNSAVTNFLGGARQYFNTALRGSRPKHK